MTRSNGGGVPSVTAVKLTSRWQSSPPAPAAPVTATARSPPEPLLPSITPPPAAPAAPSRLPGACSPHPENAARLDSRAASAAKPRSRENALIAVCSSKYHAPKLGCFVGILRPARGRDWHTLGHKSRSLGRRGTRRRRLRVDVHLADGPVAITELGIDLMNRLRAFELDEQ